MSIEKRRKNKYLLVSKKIEEYKSIKNDSALLSLQKSTSKLLSLYNDEIVKKEYKMQNALTVKYALEKKHLIFNFMALENECRGAAFDLNIFSIDPENLKEILITDENKDNKKVLKYNEYLGIYNKVQKEFKKYINEDEELNRLKQEYHTIFEKFYKNDFGCDVSSASKFDTLSWKKLIEMFDTKTFYTLTKDDLKDLCQAVSNKITNKFNTKNCPIVVTKLSNAFGQYNPFFKTIELTQDYMKYFDIYKSLNMNHKILPYQILTTTLHETRHSIQFNGEFTKNEKTGRFIQNCTFINKHYLGRVYDVQNRYNEQIYSGYYSKICEIDARDFSFKQLLDASKLDVPNAEELNNYVIHVLSRNATIKNSIIYEMASLCKDKGLNESLYTKIFETMTTLHMIDKRYMVYTDNHKIDYKQSVDNNFKNFNSLKLKLSLAKESSIREETFELACNSKKYLEDVAKEQNISVNELKEQNDTYYKEELETIKENNLESEIIS